MPSLSQIGEGWFLYIKAAPEIRELMKRRLQICDTCPAKVQTDGAGRVVSNLLGNGPENAFKCNLCSCPLGALASVRKPGCKAGKWNHLT